MTALERFAALPFANRLGIKPVPTTILTIRQVQDLICDKHGITLQELLSHRRSRPLAWARQEAYDMCRRYTGATFPMIGRHFNRDHTTVQYGIERYLERESASVQILGL
jgi:chromosomal replication initiation ATPase DnaA